VTLVLPDGVRAAVPAMSRRARMALAMMGSFPRSALGAAEPSLLALGIVAPQDVPRVVMPAAPAALDGWRFA
jgi:hypothetical protein